MDQFINKMRNNHEVDNYLKYDEKPAYLEKKTVYDSTFYRHYSQPIETDLVCFDILRSNISTTVNESIQKCERLQKILSNKQQITRDECPICYEEFGSTNFILPMCGHKVCISCFTNNARQNRENGNNCCLCRNPVMHT